jgi:tight adherence protein B
MERLEGVIRTKTAEGKAQSFLIGVLPVVIYPTMNWVDPAHFDPLKNSTIGHLLVAIAVVLWLAALFAVKKILAVQI